MDGRPRWHAIIREFYFKYTCIVSPSSSSTFLSPKRHAARVREYNYVIHIFRHGFVFKYVSHNNGLSGVNS